VITEEQLRRICLIGDQMANLCFNGSQDARNLPLNFRKPMRELYKQWDALMQEKARLDNIAKSRRAARAKKKR
jgi:hypothetical protein